MDQGDGIRRRWHSGGSEVGFRSSHDGIRGQSIEDAAKLLRSARACFLGGVWSWSMVIGAVEDGLHKLQSMRWNQEETRMVAECFTPCSGRSVASRSGSSTEYSDETRRSAEDGWDGWELDASMMGKCFWCKMQNSKPRFEARRGEGKDAWTSKWSVHPHRTTVSRLDRAPGRQRATLGQPASQVRGAAGTARGAATPATCHRSPQAFPQPMTAPLPL
ncbi:hypothetical protein QBC39DRAFT_36625 [Podospora conica]|nr:hypothetical protein QBC39DRAFT_36625 [Schizothecium conicum]